MNNYYIILDLEATCWDRELNDKDSIYKQLHEMEIIEIGAVKTDLFFNAIDEYQSFIKPVLNPVLTDFCKNLTTIKQSEVDTAREFKEVYKEFLNWAGKAELFIGWGMYDYKQIKKDCQRVGLHEISSDKYSNGKDLIKNFRGFTGKSLDTEILRYNIPFEGTHHRAICDAKMTNKILSIAFNGKK